MDLLREDQYLFLIISPSVLQMKKFADKVCRENQNTQFVFKNFFRKSYRLWNNVGKYGTARQVKCDYMEQARCMLAT